MEERAGCSYCNISIVPPVLNFMSKEGSPYQPGVQTLRVKRVGSGELFPRWYTSVDVPWVTLNPDQGDSEATIVVHVKSIGMSAGEHMANITFSSPNADIQHQYAGINLTISPKPTPLVITTSSLPPGTIGAYYSYTLEVTGGIPPYAWECTGLPKGLFINYRSGMIMGTPEVNGSFSVNVAVSDASTNVKLAKLELAVEPVLNPFRTAIMQPIGGETWYVGETREIKWMVEGDPGDQTLDIVLYTSDRYIIGRMIPASHASYLWGVLDKVSNVATIKLITDYQEVKSATFTIKQKPGCNIFSWSVNHIKKIFGIRR